MHQAASMLHTEDVGGRIRNDIRIDVDKQHAERDRNQQERFEVMPDRQVQEDERGDHHDVVAPGQVQERGLMQKI